MGNVGEVEAAGRVRVCVSVRDGDTVSLFDTVALSENDFVEVRVAVVVSVFVSVEAGSVIV